MVTFKYILASILTILLIIYILSYVVWTITPFKSFKEIHHYIMKNHEPDGNFEFDEYFIYSHCKFCGKKIILDNLGNWLIFKK